MMLCTSLAAAPIIPKEVKFLKVVPDGQRQGCSMGPQGGRRDLVAFCGRAEASGESKLANSRGVVNNIVNGCRGFGISKVEKYDARGKYEPGRVLHLNTWDETRDLYSSI
jgi:hypothetical protein